MAKKRKLRLRRGSTNITSMSFRGLRKKRRIKDLTTKIPNPTVYVAETEIPPVADDWSNIVYLHGLFSADAASVSSIVSQLARTAGPLRLSRRVIGQIPSGPHDPFTYEECDVPAWRNDIIGEHNIVACNALHHWRVVTIYTGVDGGQVESLQPVAYLTIAFNSNRQLLPEYTHQTMGLVSASSQHNQSWRRIQREADRY